MTISNLARTASLLSIAAGLVTLPSFAAGPVAPVPQCDGDKKGKEVKKPKDDTEKRPNPASTFR
jgi:hypothetical protein